MIRVESVSKVYKESVVALRDVSAEIAKGEFVFLVGSTGSGKTTLIKMLLREEEPSEGRIYVAGKDLSLLPRWRIPYLRRMIGCVFQDYKLLPNKTVYENVAFALEVIGRPRHVIRERVPEILDLVGLVLGNIEDLGHVGHRRDGVSELVVLGGGDVVTEEDVELDLAFPLADHVGDDVADDDDAAEQEQAHGDRGDGGDGHEEVPPQVDDRLAGEVLET